MVFLYEVLPSTGPALLVLHPVSSHSYMMLNFRLLGIEKILKMRHSCLLHS